MLDGVQWAAAEIVFYMLLATLVGFAIAYVFIRWFQKSSIAEGYEAELAAKDEQARRAEHRLMESNSTLDKLQLELKGEHERIGELESQLEAAQAAVGELQAAVPDEDEVAQLQTDLAASRAETEQLTARVAELDRTLAEHEAAAAESGEAIAQLRADLEASQGEGGNLQTRIAELTALADKRAARIAELEAAAVDAAEIERLGGDLAACSEDRERLQIRVAALEGELEARDTAGVPAEPASPAPAVAPAADGAAAAEPSREEGLARIAEIAARTSGGGPAVDDDLKKVHGIGPKLEKTLKGLGITSYRQIANFQSDDIAYVTAALDAFKGRIERDDWMSSAAEEHTKKYNEPV